MGFNIFKTIAIIGLIILTVGVLSKKDSRRNLFFLIGGILLVVYSVYIKDAIIISLQIIFTLAAGYKIMIKK